jgi:hypothetical protein
MKPLRGHSREAQDVGEAVRAHVQPLHTTDGLTYLVADSALYRIFPPDPKRSRPVTSLNSHNQSC